MAWQLATLIAFVLPEGAKFNRNYVKRLGDVSVWDSAKATRKYMENFKHPEKYFISINLEKCVCKNLSIPGRILSPPAALPRPKSWLKI